eukprot:gene4894-5534_t
MKALKLQDGGTVGGRGRLTDARIDSLQNYYGYAIRAHPNDLKATQNAVWAVYNHTIAGYKKNLATQHKCCSKGKDSWCKYQRDVVLKTNTYDQSKCLPRVFRKELLPLFKRLSSGDLLSRCLKGLTQNQNEAINNVLWMKCPKSVFRGRKRLETAIAATVLQWNKGAGAITYVMEKPGVKDIGANRFKGCRLINASRLTGATQKCKNKYKKQRRNLRRKRKQNTNAGQHYLAGGFSIHKTPDNLLRKVNNAEKNITTTDIKFVNENDIPLVQRNVKRTAKK